MAMKLLLRHPDRESRPHHSVSQIQLEPPSHLLLPEGDHRKRGNITETTQNARVS